MHVVIPWQGSFPHGMALANRFIALARGLQQTGASVRFVCLLPACREHAPADLALSGTHAGVLYHYAGGELFLSRRRLGRVRQRFAGLFRGLCELNRLRAEGELDLVLFPSMASLETAAILLVGRRLGVPAVHERNEHPLLVTSKGWLRKIERQFYLRCLIRFCDGMVVISHPLAAVFRPRMNRQAPLLVIPATVDMDRFADDAQPGPPPLEGRYIAWCGSVWGRKDGVVQLVQAFGRIASAHPGVRLVLIAPHDATDDFRQVMDAIRDSGLGDRIVLTGAVTQAEMPRYLCGAAALALARPASLQATHGFSTKLAEYLATGRPVVVTRVGDIPRYLSDGVDAYLAEPDDIAGFAAKLDDLLRHPDQAREVGRHGQETAQRVFSGAAQARELAVFLRNLV